MFYPQLPQQLTSLTAAMEQNALSRTRVGSSSASARTPKMHFNSPASPFFAHNGEGQFVRNFQQLSFRPFSNSSYHPALRPQFQAKSSIEQDQCVQLEQYINPNTEKAHHAFNAHYQRWYSSRAEESYKTVMCQNWLERAHCHFGNKCRFAHGPEELRAPTLPLPINKKYKTRACEKYSKGICPYGIRCLFIHPGQENVTMPASGQLQHSLSKQKKSGAIDQQRQYAFTTSLPATFSNGHNAQQYRTSQPKKRNLFPQVYEELCREQNEQQENQEPSSSHSPPSSGSTMLRELSSPSHDEDMSTMVDRLVSTPCSSKNNVFHSLTNY